MRSLCLLLLGVLACGGDDGTGPADANVSGTWNTVSDLTGGGSSCSSTVPTTLSLTQSGGGFAGLFSGGEVACTGPNGAFSFAVGSGDIINGELDGSSISFDLDSPDFHHRGTVSGSSMSGTATWNFFFGPETDPVVLTGTWEAVRQ
jgi:hypothetical protein